MGFEAADPMMLSFRGRREDGGVTLGFGGNSGTLSHPLDQESTPARYVFSIERPCLPCRGFGSSPFCADLGFKYTWET